VISTFFNMRALDRLLLERFGGMVGRGLAVELSRRHDCPNVRNFYLPRSSPYSQRVVKPAPKQGIMPGCKLMFVVNRRECRAWV
jgi:hypothetical protein